MRKPKQNQETQRPAPGERVTFGFEGNATPLCRTEAPKQFFFLRDGGASAEDARRETMLRFPGVRIVLAEAPQTVQREKEKPAAVPDHAIRFPELKQWGKLTLTMLPWEKGIVRVAIGEIVKGEFSRDALGFSPADMEELAFARDGNGDLRQSSRSIGLAPKRKQRLSRLRKNLRRLFPEASGNPLPESKTALFTVKEPEPEEYQKIVNQECPMDYGFTDGCTGRDSEE